MTEMEKMQNPIGPIERRTLRITPDRFRKAIMCPGTEEEATPEMCWLCSANVGHGLNCPHKLGSITNMVYRLINNPQDYPEWMHRELAPQIYQIKARRGLV